MMHTYVHTFYRAKVLLFFDIHKKKLYFAAVLLIFNPPYAKFLMNSTCEKSLKLSRLQSRYRRQVRGI